MRTVVERFFRFREHGTAMSTEFYAGLTTFAAMAYIVFLQPMIMSGRLLGTDTGMDFGALITTTCMVSALGCLLMGLMANFPVGLAPGMGENFLFVLSLLPVAAASLGVKSGDPAAWRLGLGVVLVSGVIFVVISFMNIRRMIMNAISHSLKHAIAAGIGIFIALLGMQNSQMIKLQGTHFELNFNLRNPAVWVFLTGLVVIAVLHVLRIRGSILIGILAATGMAVALGQVKLVYPLGVPNNPMPLIAHADIGGVFTHFKALLPMIVIFTFMDVFDTMGCVIGIGAQAGLLKNDELPNSSRIFAADAIATAAGAVCGHSTVTSYIESATGVDAGGRTGMTAVVVGLAFLAAMFFTPFIMAVAAYMPITAPALVVVGAIMMKSVVEIDWADYSEGIPAFLILVGIPFTSSIADGMLLGFVIYPVIKLFSGKGRSIGWLNYALAALLLLYLLFIKSH